MTPNKLHCPKCKSNNITITTESSLSAGLTTTRGNHSATQFESTHRNYWICQDCGTKFRNIQSLEEEIYACRNRPKIFNILGIISLVLLVILTGSAMLSLVNNPMITLTLIFWFPVLSFFFIFAIVFFAVGASARKKLTAMKKELEYLSTNCFD